jgi:hypothetical protein
MTNTTSFSRGQTVVVWLVVNNLGSDLNMLPQGPILWIEVDDSNNAPLTVQYHIGLLPGSGQVTREGFSVVLSYSPGVYVPTGTYKATGFVSDKMISQGGKFIAPQVSVTFTVS